MGVLSRSYLLREKSARWQGVFQEIGVKMGVGRPDPQALKGERKASESAVTVSVNEDWPDFQALEGEGSWHL